MRLVRLRGWYLKDIWNVGAGSGSRTIRAIIRHVIWKELTALATGFRPSCARQNFRVQIKHHLSFMSLAPGWKSGNVKVRPLLSNSTFPKILRLTWWNSQPHLSRRSPGSQSRTFPQPADLSLDQHFSVPFLETCRPVKLRSAVSTLSVDFILSTCLISTCANLIE